MEYKVGDKVELLESYDHYCLKHNKIYEIINIEAGANRGSCYIVNGEGANGIYLYKYKVKLAEFDCTCGIKVCDNCREYRKNPTKSAG